jgi:uncharacterized membrane protein
MLAVLSLMLLSLSRPVQAQEEPESLFAPGYLYFRLDAPNTLSTYWRGINNAGTIVGEVLDARTRLYTAAVYQNRKSTEVSIPNSASSLLSAVNNLGTAVGRYTDRRGLTHSFTRAKDGRLTFLPDVVAGGSTVANGINDDGVIVGWYSKTSTGIRSGFVCQHGVYTTYHFPGATHTYLRGINNDNLIMGEYDDARGVIHCFVLIWEGKATFPILAPWNTQNAPGIIQTAAYTINNRGQVVGDNFWGPYANPTGTRGFLLSQDVFTKLEFPGALDTTADGINDAGEIVGFYVEKDLSVHGYVAMKLP